MGSRRIAGLRGRPPARHPGAGTRGPCRELRRSGPAIHTTTPPRHARGSACIHISTVVHRVGICPSDTVSQPTLVENDGLVARRGRISENPPIRRAPPDVSARTRAFAAGTHEARPSASRGAYRDATKTSQLFGQRRPLGPPSAEAHARRMIRIRRVYESPAPGDGAASSWSHSGRGESGGPFSASTAGSRTWRRPTTSVAGSATIRGVDGGPIPLPSRAEGPSQRVAAARRGRTARPRDPARRRGGPPQQCGRPEGIPQGARVPRGASARSRRHARNRV